MNFKQLSAIALTLIIACPIALGYMLSLEDEDITSWTVKDSVNVSDVMLNSTDYTYSVSSTVQDNLSIYDSSTLTLYQVDYVRVGTTYSNWPVDLTAGTYADPSYGWHLPASVAGHWVEWSTLQDCDMVAFSIALTNGASFELGAFRNNITPVGSEPVDILIQYTTAGGCVIDGDYFGNYSKLFVILNADSTFTVTGLTDWGTFGSTASGFNSKTFGEAQAISAGMFDVKIPSASISKVTFRVEYANHVIGTYPVTYNYTLNLQTLYPDNSWNLKLNSIGLYGDSFQFAGSSYTLNNNKILVDGSWVNLRGITLSSRLEDSGNYVNSINGHEVGKTSAPATVYFGGEWSLTATAEILEQTTETKLTWHAGGFGLDREGFIAAGLLVCVAAFVVLGASGRMSGPKAAFLALICGGGALIYLMIL